MEVLTMPDLSLTRREAIASAAAGLALMAMPSFVFAGQTSDEELTPFINEPRSRPNSLDWETLAEWLTPSDQVFSVQHYGVPEFDAAKYELEITGLVERPRRLSLDDIQALPRHEQHMTLECSGNGSSPGFMNAVYNSRWAGTPLAPLLKECRIKPQAIEVVFFGFDQNDETLRKGTPRELTVPVPFARSMSLEDALGLNVLLAFERNGEPLAKRNGAPVRLIVPGWYGIANVKWLRRIELRDRRFMGKFMGRDYVTVRGERHGNEVVFVETSVARMNLKSVVARVTRLPANDGKVPLKAYGAVWGDGTPLQKVEVKLDDGPWREAKFDAEPMEKFSWRFFSIELGGVAPGKHVVVSRAIDQNGRTQPTAQDDEIALKKTYWEAFEQWPRTVNIEA
jgi:DMSO/TMAO reductase YedYZ molybdopterin-dependent catalytic subunit